MMKLKIWTKPAQEYYALISLENVLWGILPAKILHSLYPIPCDCEIPEAASEDLIQMLQRFAGEKLLDYLAKFERCTFQAKTYLQKYRFHRSIIDACIAEALERGYLDDIRFSEIYIRSLAERNKSRNYIIGKLYELHIPETLYTPFLEEYSDRESQKEILREEIHKLKLRYCDLPLPKQREKILSSLYRKGFDLDLIRGMWD